MREEKKNSKCMNILKQNRNNNNKKNADMKRMSIVFITWHGTAMGGFGQVNMTECALMDLFRVCLMLLLFYKGVFLLISWKGRYRRALDHLPS